MVLCICAIAQADENKLTVAIYAPNGQFDSAEARYGLASKLAQAIGGATGATVEPRAYAHAGDFEAAVKKGVDFAVVDGVYLAERGVPWPVLAALSTGGDTSARWGLYAGDGSSVIDMEGKRLAVASTGGRDAQFIDNALLDGELPKLWGSRQPTPDLAGAVAAVSLKKANAVFAPEGLARGLKRVFDAGRVPNAALVETRAGHAADLVAKVKAAALGMAGAGAYDGFKASSAEPYRALASRLAPRVRRPVMAEPEVVKLDDGDVLVVPPLQPALPDVKELFWIPSGVP